jgi:NTE family protein
MSSTQSVPSATQPVPSASGIVIDHSAEYGFSRPPDLQAQFAAAASQLRAKDAYPGPKPSGLVADLAIEGGGVKGIGIVGAVSVLAEAGYQFQRIAGSSAGAIAAALIASMTKAGAPMTGLKQTLESFKFGDVMTQGPLHRFLDHFGKGGDEFADAAILTHKTGIYSGDYIENWLASTLGNLGVTTFADLKLTEADDPNMSLPEDRRYRLVVHTADITRGQLVHLPWDYGYYGATPDEQKVAEAVRASMSIPFFFDPVTFDAQACDVQLPTPDGTTLGAHYEAGTVTWVDGGMLRNFPIDAFERDDGQPPRWPTIGIKLSSLQTSYGPTKAVTTAFEVARHCLKTMMNEWDAYSIDAATAGRTIFVDHGSVGTTDFNITQDQQDQLFLNGVAAATSFVIEMGNRGRVPRTAGESAAMLHAPPA